MKALKSTDILKLSMLDGLPQFVTPVLVPLEDDRDNGFARDEDRDRGNRGTGKDFFNEACADASLLPAPKD